MVFYHLNRKITYTDILQAIILKCKKKKKVVVYITNGTITLKKKNQVLRTRAILRKPKFQKNVNKMTP